MTPSFANNSQVGKLAGRSFIRSSSHQRPGQPAPPEPERIDDPPSRSPRDHVLTGGLLAEAGASD